jgi:hypothetical protein
MGERRWKMGDGRVKRKVDPEKGDKKGIAKTQRL